MSPFAPHSPTHKYGGRGRGRGKSSNKQFISCSPLREPSATASLSHRGLAHFSTSISDQTSMFSRAQSNARGSRLRLRRPLKVKQYPRPLAQRMPSSMPSQKGRNVEARLQPLAIEAEPRHSAPPRRSRISKSLGERALGRAGIVRSRSSVETRDQIFFHEGLIQEA